jgi:hypothetical protein
LNWFRPLGVAALAWRSVVGVADRSSIWMPVLMIASVQAPILCLLVFFHQPPLVPFAAPLVQALGGEVATHYPFHFFALPAMYDKVAAGIDILLAWVVPGVATLRFAAAFGLAHEESAWAVATRCAPALVGLALLAAGARQAASALFGLLPVEARLESSLLRWIALAGKPLLVVLAHALLAYSTAFVVLKGRSMWSAIRDSVGLARWVFAPTIILVAVPAGLLAPFSYVLSRVSPSTVPRPELVAGVVGLRIVATVLLTFVLVGSITRMFVSATRTGR